MNEVTATASAAQAPEIRRFRTIAYLEALSFLVLLGIAMPLKYAAGDPRWVTYVGWVHGVLFVWFLLAYRSAYAVARWPSPRAQWILVSSLIPFAPFFVHMEAAEERS